MTCVPPNRSSCAAGEVGHAFKLGVHLETEVFIRLEGLAGEAHPSEREEASRPQKLCPGTGSGPTSLSCSHAHDCPACTRSSKLSQHTFFFNLPS